MRRLRLVIFILAGLAVLTGLTFFLVGQLRPKVAGIYVDSQPTSVVYVDGRQVGRTPYREKIDPGEVVIKLVPDSFEIPLLPYETKVNLTPGVETVIRRDFGELEEDSSGEIISFEKIGGQESTLSIVTVPDSAQLLIDGRERAIAPFKTSVSPDEHSMVVSADGYTERVIQAKTFPGYNLTAVVKLAQKVEEHEEEQTSEETEEVEDEYVEILSTPTGFLRVRNEPSTLGEEIGRVEPGESYIYLDTDARTGWFKIQFDEEEEGLPAQTGWISNQYAQIATSSATTPTPTP